MPRTVVSSDGEKTLFYSFLEVLETCESEAEMKRLLQEDKQLRRAQRIFEFHERQRFDAVEMMRCMNFMAAQANKLETAMRNWNTTRANGAGEAPLNAQLVRQAARLRTCMSECIANASRIRQLLTDAHKSQMDALLAKMEAKLSTWTAFLHRAIEATFSTEIFIDNVQNMIAEHQQRLREVSTSHVFTSLSGAGSPALLLTPEPDESVPTINYLYARSTSHAQESTSHAQESASHAQESTSHAQESTSHAQPSTSHAHAPSTSYEHAITSYAHAPSTSYEHPSASHAQAPSTSYAHVPSTSYEHASTSHAHAPSTSNEHAITSYAHAPSTSYEHPSASHAQAPSTSYAHVPSTSYEHASTSHAHAPSTSYEHASTSHAHAPSTSYEHASTSHAHASTSHAYASTSHAEADVTPLSPLGRRAPSIACSTPIARD